MKKMNRLPLIAAFTAVGSAVCTVKPFRVVLMSAFALGLSACVNLDPVQGHALSTTMEQRFTDEAIARDRAAIQDLRSRVAAVRARAPSLYAVTRSELMIEFGVKEYEENDKTGILEPVLDDALRLLVSQEQARTNVDLAIPKFPGSSKVYPDLWAKINAIKEDAAQLKCVGEALARLEVALLELAHERYEVDTQLNTPEHVLPSISIVNIMVSQLEEALAACHLAPLSAPPVSGAPDSAPRHFVLNGDVLFPFDKSAEQDLTVDGKLKLDAFAAKLIKDSTLWHGMVITGHTDRLGKPDYNKQLGRRRADSIRHYLISRFGLPSEQIQTQSMGDTQPVKNCPDVKDTEQLKACLQPNRRVEIKLQ